MGRRTHRRSHLLGNLVGRCAPRERRGGQRAASSDHQRSTSDHQRSLRAQQAHRARRHGRRLPRARPAARPPGRHQGAVPRVRHRPQLRRALPPRGPGGGQPQPPEHRQRLRLGQARRHVLHRHGVRRRPHARRHPALQRPRHRQAGGGDRQRGGRGAELRPRGRPRAPRHQAGEHPHRLQRPGEGRRLRHRPGDERADRVEPDAGRGGDGHGDVLLARAGPGRPARPAQRPLLARHRDVRDGRRAAAVHRREPGEHRLQAGPRPTRSR